MHYRIKSVLALLLIILSVGICSQTVNAAEQNKVYTSDHIKDEEARQVYQRLLDATSFMLEDSENSKECLYVYGTDEIRDLFCDNHINAVNISEESFYAMSAYEFFLEYVTYGNIQTKFLLTPHVLSTEQELLYKMKTGELLIPDLIVKWYREGTNKEPYEAFEELYIYQYKYLQEHGCFYDFFRGADYFELQGMVPQKDEISKEEPSVETKQEVQENEDIEIEEVKSEVSEEKKDKPSEPKDTEKNYVGVIVIFAIMIILIMAIVLITKRLLKQSNNV